MEFVISVPKLWESRIEATPPPHANANCGNRPPATFPLSGR